MTNHVPTAKIFISYRRADSTDITGRIYDRLVEHFGKDAVFKDVDNIPFGVNFKSHLSDILAQCAVELVVIGPRWLEATDSAGRRRIDDPADFVRIEVESGLSRDIPVIPLLVYGASMPGDDRLPPSLAELAYRNGIPVRPDPDFHKDMGRLIRQLEQYVPPASLRPPVTRSESERSMSEALHQPSWDVFISHASEDKETVARPLADALARRGLRVWLDEQQLVLGDSLRRKIDEGLSKSRYGIVILSHRFFAKGWPKKELDALVAREDGKAKVILPIWHKVSVSDVASFSPMLADKIAVSTSEGLEKVVSNILRAISPVVHFEPELILIPAGEFLMGSDPSVDKYALDGEQPQHRLHLPNYFIAKTPVTNAQYAAFVERTNHERPKHWEGGKLPKGEEDHPVVYVHWYDAVAYCNWLTEVTDKAYRLPSEAEWEKGARGTDGRIYPWGNQWNPGRCNSLEAGPGSITPVEAYPKGVSPYGLLDMVGNVWEWTRSLWGQEEPKPDFKYPYDPADGREDFRASDNVRRVLRGGAFVDNDRGARCARRYSEEPQRRIRKLGFRVCVAPWQD